MHLSKADNALSEFSDPYSECDWPLEHTKTTDPMFDSPLGVIVESGVDG
jgi:hypothetical protein